MSSRVNRRLRAVAHAFGARSRVEAGFGLVEAVIAMSLFLVVATSMSQILTTSVNSHGFTTDQTLGQEAADAQIEDVRALPYDSVGTTSGNPPGSVAPTESAAAVGVTGLPATVTTSIHYVGDGIPDGYNDQTNYKQVVVSVTRNLDGLNLATESTYIAPPTRAPYGGINQVALGVIVTDVGDNQPVSGVPIALQTGPSAPRNDTTDTNGGVLFAGMTANPTSGSTQYYNVVPTLPSGYVEMPGDVKQAQLNPGQITNLSIRVYQPATIYVHLTSGGSDYAGAATVTVTAPSGSSQDYAVSGNAGGEYTIPNQVPNGQYTVTAKTAGGLYSKAIVQTVPNNYPTDLTSSFALDLAPPTGTLSVTALNGVTPISGVGVTVTGGPSGVTLTGTTDPNGVLNFPSVPAGPGFYTVTGTYGAATFQQTNVTVATNTPTPVTLGVTAGSVQVSVTDGSAHPVQGATLTLTGPNGFSAVGTSNGSGTFTFANVGTGLNAYTVVATDGAATAQASSISVSTGGTTSVALSLNVGTVTVTVTDGTNPLGNVPVTLTGPNSLVVIGTTDPVTGVYSFPNIGAGGGYTVSAADGAATTSVSGQSVTSGGTTSVNLTLSVGSIRAAVTEGGVPLPNAKVTVTGPNAYSVTQTANAAGISTFSVGAGSGYTVSASDGPGTAQQTGVSVSGGATTSVPLDISAGSVKVTVDAGSSGLPGVAVTLSGPNGYSATPGTTNGSGVYTFATVPVGTGFTVTATTPGTSATQTGVSVSAGATTQVTLTLPTGTIRASVTVGGTALTGQTVTVTGPGSYSASAVTDSTGLAVIANVPVGTAYTVSTTYGTTVQQTGQSVTKNGHTDVLLAIPGGSLTVTVQNQSGTAIQGAPVTLATTNGITLPPGTTSTSGTYTFNLPTGTGYTVTAKDGAGSATSTSQTVTSGNTTNVTLTLSTGSILVTVKNQSGTALTGPAPGAALTLTGPNSFSATGTTGTGNTTTFANVPVGSGGYSVAATYGAASATTTGIVVSATSPATPALVTIQTGSIAVTVKDQNGTAINGASLTLSGPGSYTATGSAGAGSNTYTFPNVPVGSGTYSVGATAGAGTGTSAAITVSATSPAAPAAVTIQTGSIAVTVKDQNGVALNGASLTLTGPGAYSATGSTGSGNTYTFPSVPIGTGGYSVAATVGAGSGTATAIVVSAATPATAATVTIQTGSIAVTTKNQSGSAVNGVSLTLSSGTYSATGSTGSGNTYTFPNVPLGNGYTVVGTVGSGTGNTTGINVTATTPAKAVTVTITTGTIAVTVKNQSGSALNGASLSLTGPGSYTATGATAANGNTFTFSGVPLGNGYSVVATVGAGSGTTGGINVTSGSPNPSATVTIQTGSIAVTVKDQNGVALNAVTVTLTGPGSYSVSGATASNGNTLTFSNVPLGNGYSVAGTVGGGTATTPGVNVTATSPAAPAAVTIQTGTVKITVKTASCALRTGVNVTVTGPNGYSVTAASANPSGIATFIIPAGNGYTASASGSGTHGFNVPANVTTTFTLSTGACP